MTLQDFEEQFPHARVYDVSRYYTDFVAFTANSVYPIHRWYRFKEGYSRDLVYLLLTSSREKVQTCLDPFSGSGTTALACQELGVACHSIEVNPFMHHVARAKLTSDYRSTDFDAAISQTRVELQTNPDPLVQEPIMSTITERPGSTKWLFSRPALKGVLSIRDIVKRIAAPYSDLLLLILASILTEVGNTTKDGKCVRYKSNWREIKIEAEDVYRLFFERAVIFRQDIQYIENQHWSSSNAALCLNGSAAKRLKGIPDRSVDMVITSPPYLNSFDYTDVYMPELWTLGFVSSYEDVRTLRKSTICSHVQVNWDTDASKLDEPLKSLISQVTSVPSLWNKTIPAMIAGYFLDMQEVFLELRRVLRPGGKVCMVVGTSSYYRVTLPTDLLLSKLAETLGFVLEEVKIVRTLKRSSKQPPLEGETQAGLLLD